MSGAQDPARRVRVLPVALANQIAAGEVVERPASVAKELLENSLDAGARRIRIEVEQGGIGLIRVRDDGAGIHAEDLALALSRHATSKVGTLEELERVRSLGFRGEALPSIASVSRLRLSSRRAGEDGGWQVRAEGGAGPSAPAPEPHPPGTTVEVRDLFFNTPARRRFLRTEKTEFRHLDEVVRRVALSHPEVAIRLEHNRRAVLALGAAAGAETARLARICGRSFVEQALAVDFEAGELRLHGWIGRPELTRPRGDLQHLFVNGRTVRDRVLGHAVRLAYGELLAAGRHPAYVLHLRMDPRQVDVNVHPAKHEVRFRESRLVHDFLHRGLQRALSAALQPGLAVPPVPARPPARGTPPAPRGAAVAEQLSGYAALHAHATPGREHRGGPLGRLIGRLAADYLLAGNDAGLVVVDVRAARERLAALRMRRMLESDAPASRPLLIPLQAELGEAGAERLGQHAAALARLGFELRRSGPGAVILREVPAPLAGADPAALLEALGAALPAQRDGALEPLIEPLARHAGGAGDGGEPAALLRELEAAMAAGGEQALRGAWLQLPFEELQRLLRRGG